MTDYAERLQTMNFYFIAREKTGEKRGYIACKDKDNRIYLPGSGQFYTEEEFKRWFKVETEVIHFQTAYDLLMEHHRKVTI